MALCEAEKASMAFFFFFFFDFWDVDKQNLRNLLLSLLIQLPTSTRSDSCCDILSRHYSANNRGAQKPCDRAMTECLKEMLAHMVQGPIYVIMDALDECKPALLLIEEGYCHIALEYHCVLLSSYSSYF